MKIGRFVTSEGDVVVGEWDGGESVSLLCDGVGLLTGEPTGRREDVLRGLRVVVADDDPLMRETMARVFEVFECDTTVCIDGAEAMNAIHGTSPQLVVSDIAMPHHDGYEIYQAARAKDCGTPVVLVTGFGYDPNHALVKASKDGHERVLFKPFTPAELVREACDAVIDVRGAGGCPIVSTGKTATVTERLAPVSPPDIICVGRNYRGAGSTDPSDALADMEVFLKPTGSIIGDRGVIRIPTFDGVEPRVECETELAFIVGHDVADLASEEEALESVLGFTVAIDVTARAWQRDDGIPAWMRGKGFRGFCPVGPCVVTADEVGPLDALRVVTRVNETVVQDGTTASMLRSPMQILIELSRRMPVRAGTLVLTGTPGFDRGVDCEVRAGDTVEAEIESIGRLTCTAAAGTA